MSTKRLGMAAVISHSENYLKIEQVLESKDIQVTLKEINNEVSFKEFKTKLINVPIGYLIVDLDSVVDLNEFVIELKKYKIYGCRPSTKIILITKNPHVKEVGKAISKSINLGVYNIACPIQEYNTDFDLGAALETEIEAEGELKRVARWIVEDDSAETTTDTTSSRGKVIEKVVEKVIEKEKYIGTIVIAVAGAERRVGSTHTVLTLASFLKEQGKSVAVMETFKTNTFNQIKDSYDGIQYNRDGSFMLKEICFYPSESKVSDALEKGYNFLILDMGAYEQVNLEEFKRAHLRLIITCSKEWELDGLTAIIQNEELKNKNKYLFNFTDNDTYKLITSSMPGLECYSMPYNASYSKVENSLGDLYLQLLEQFLGVSNDNRGTNKGLSMLVNAFKRKGTV